MLTREMLICFAHPIFQFWFLVTFGEYYLIFLYILLGKMGKMGKKRKENHETKMTNIPKSKDKNVE